MALPSAASWAFPAATCQVARAGNILTCRFASGCFAPPTSFGISLLWFVSSTTRSCLAQHVVDCCSTLRAPAASNPAVRRGPTFAASCGDPSEQIDVSVGLKFLHTSILHLFGNNTA